MSLQDLASLAGMPGLDLAMTFAYNLYESVQNVKLYREQCRDLSRRCNVLLLALRENSVGLEGTEMLRAADEVEDIIRRANSRAKEWAGMSRVKSFIHQSDIQSGLEKLYKDIDLCMVQFNIASQLEVGRGINHLAAIQARDHAENREMLQTIVRNVDDMRTIIGMHEPAVANFMQTIQEELQDEEAPSPAQTRVLQEGLVQLHRATGLLPPLAELTGQVVKTSADPIVFGAYNDVYTGEWLGEQKVALKLPRAINQTPVAKKRFHKEVEIWRNLQHPHVSRLYGIVYMGDHVYSVSPWMEHRDALTYISKHPHADRVKLLAEVASGMEYLHLNKVIHGDLRGANILVSETGSACLSDFGLSKVIEEVSPDSLSLSGTGASPVRWQAPELMSPEDYGLEHVSMTTSTDVWSFGMLCVELATGDKPFPHRPRDALVIRDVVAGKLPDRPPGVSDRFWNMVQSCWHKEPSKRATMSEIRAELKACLMLKDASPPPHFTESPRPGFIELQNPAESSRTQGFSPLSSTPPRSSALKNGRPASSPASSGMGHGQPGVSRTRSDTSSTSQSATGFYESPRQATSSHGYRRDRPSFPSLRSPAPISPEIQVTPPPQRLSANPPLSTSSGSGSPIFRATSRSSLPEPATRQTSRSSYQHVGASALSISIREHSPSRNESPVTAPESGGQSYIASRSSDFEPSSLPANFGSHRPQSSRSDSVMFEVASNYSSDGSSAHLLEAALTDEACIVHNAKDGSVACGTLNGLVNRLVTCYDYAQDRIFLDVFLKSYTAFTTAADVFQLLVRFFRETERDRLMGSEAKSNTRSRVVLVLKVWLTQYSTDRFDAPLLEDMLSFTAGITSPPTIAAAARELTKLIGELIAKIQKQPLSPICATSSDRAVPNARDITPRDLAIALTILESSKFQEITPADLISHLQNPSGRSNVGYAKVTNDKIVNWVKRSILRSHRLQSRTETLKFFVNVAEECRSLNNFSSMSAVAGGLVSTMIARLVLTGSHLDKHTLNLLKGLASYLEPEGNHKAYRKQLKNRTGPCVPWLPVHLKDLSASLRSCRKTVESPDGRVCINFQRYMRVAATSEEIMTLKEKTYNLDAHRGTGAHAYLEAELRKTAVDALTDDALEARSQALKREEDLMFDKRVIELNAVGFKAKSPR